jgi:hypothetical protein
MRLEQNQDQSLIEISDQSVSDAVKESLNLAVREEIIEKLTTERAFIFSHDKLHSVFGDMFQDLGDSSTVDFLVAQTFLTLVGLEMQRSTQTLQRCYTKGTMEELH